MIKEDYVMLMGKRNFLVKLNNEKFHTQYGILDLSKIKKMDWGDKIYTHSNEMFIIVKPTMIDFLNKKMKRLPQIITPEDTSLILSITGIPDKSIIIDAGTGSGFLCMFLGYYLKNSKIITYEKNTNFYNSAKKNIEMLKLKNVKIVNEDITDGMKEKNVDMVTLDMKDAEKIIEDAYKSLKIGGWLVIFSPYIEQVKLVINEINKYNFVNLKTIENIRREWQTEVFTRPKTLGIMHTGWLTFARKLY